MTLNSNSTIKKTSSLSLKELSQKILQEESFLKDGGGEVGKKRQKKLGRLTARERLDLLLDAPSSFLELGIWAGYKMYDKWGALPAAGVIAGIGKISNRECMVIANDATVKAGAMFPQSVKKLLRAQRIAYQCRLPIIYLVDSAGVFLPLQDEIFPDEDDFGRIFRNNSVLSASNIPQYAAIMGNCIAGGAYLPVLCDKLLMTEGSGLYLAGPALVKAAIGQVVDSEELGGAKMHSEISGTVDFLEPDDPSCLIQLRSLVEALPKDPPSTKKEIPTDSPIENVYKIVGGEAPKEYNALDLISCLVDKGSIQEYKTGYGKTLVTVFAKIGNQPVGIVANQKKQCFSKSGKVEIGGVIYKESSDKAARFIMDCNQMKIPLIFLQDVMGFMVGKEAEQSGIIRSGAKLVSAVSNSVVPKITIVVGSSFGAGNYALCGKAYDPDFILAWPNAKYAVMGADQAATTLFSIRERAAIKKGEPLDKEHLEEMHKEVKGHYTEQMDIRYGAARGWVDAIIEPGKTRGVLLKLLDHVNRRPISELTFKTGVIQV